MLIRSGILLVRNSLEEEENIYRTKEKIKGNDALLFRMQNSLQAISLERKVVHDDSVLKLYQDLNQCFENGPMPCQCADTVLTAAVYKFEIGRVYCQTIVLVRMESIRKSYWVSDQHYLGGV